MRIGAHAQIAFRSQRRQFGNKSAGFVEQLFRLIAFHPLFKHLQMSGLSRQFSQRHLMRTPGVFNRQAVNFFGPGPAFGGAHDDHRPHRTFSKAFRPDFRLDFPDFVDGLFHHLRHDLVDFKRLVAFDKVRFISVAAEQFVQFLVADARQNRWIGDLVTV